MEEMNRPVLHPSPRSGTVLTRNSYDMYQDVEGKLGLGPDNEGLPV